MKCVRGTSDHQPTETAGGFRRRLGVIAAGLLAVVVVLLLIQGVLIFWRQGDTRVSGSPATEHAELRPDRIAPVLAPWPVKIADRVYFLGNMRPSAVYVVETSDGLALIDTGLESAHDKLIDGMSRLGLEIGRLKIILITHSHGDHTMGAQRLRDETGAKIYIGRGDAGALRRGGPWEAIFSMFDMPGESPHPTRVDGELVDNQVIELAEAKFVVLATPGHTPGSCCFLLELNGRRILFTGDVIQAFTDDIGTYAVALPPRYGGDLDNYLHSLQRLRRLAAPDFVLPGHPASDGPLDPRLTEDQWIALLDRGIAELEKWRERYARDGADFLDGSPKEILEGVYYLGDFEGRAAYALVSGGRALLFDGARGADAAERLAAAWQSLGVTAPAVAAIVLTSCEPENLTGLTSFVASAGCPVLVPDGGQEAVAALSPANCDIRPAGEVSDFGSDGVRVVPIAGLGRPLAAYSFRRGNVTVLISGAWPVDGGGTDFERLLRQGPPRDWDAQLLLSSLDELTEIQPNIWLSPSPWRGRNANLYDQAWTNRLMLNRRLFRQWHEERTRDR
jgi:glyoxylase-like metal-dependent hydrolase (beta-lactamase superfamily II)